MTRLLIGATLSPLGLIVGFIVYPQTSVRDALIWIWATAMVSAVLALLSMMLRNERKRRPQ